MAKARLRICGRRRSPGESSGWGLFVGAAEGRVFGQRPDLALDGGTLAAEEILDRGGEARLADPMCAPGRRRQVAALDLVLALGAGLDPRQLVRDRVLDGLVVAGLEMQETEVAEAAPVAAVERVATPEIEGAGHGPSLLLGDHQHDAICERAADAVEKAARQVGPAPF